MCPRGQFMQMFPEDPSDLWAACDGQEDRKCAERCYARYFSGAPEERGSDIAYWTTHIRRDGSLLHGRWFVDLDVFHKSFARARDEGGWMHVDLQGRPAYERRFHAVEPFYNGQARVERFDGALEVIGEAGATLVELRSPRRSG